MRTVPVALSAYFRSRLFEKARSALDSAYA
jgi:hypothetical protein